MAAYITWAASRSHHELDDPDRAVAEVL